MSESFSNVAIPPPGGEEDSEEPREFPYGFEPLRSEQLAEMNVQSSPIVRNPYMSPLLAPDSMLKGLPPIHIVVRLIKVLLQLMSLRRYAWYFIFLLVCLSLRPLFIPLFSGLSSGPHARRLCDVCQKAPKCRSASDPMRRG